MNKKVMILLGTVVAAGALLAGPRGGPRPGGHRGFRPAPIHHAPVHHHHHGSFWGRGGSHFWPGFVGGIIGGTLVDAVVTTPVVSTTVVTTPVVTTPVVVQPVQTTQQVWVPGCYVDQIQPNGVTLRVWQPGHYETRTVVVQ